MNSPTVAEIVTFRLVKDIDPHVFLEAANQMTPFLRSTDAMISRTLSHDTDGVWTEHVTWTSLTAAKQAAKAMFERPEAQPFMQMICPDTVSMRHAAIGLYVPPE